MTHPFLSDTMYSVLGLQIVIKTEAPIVKNNMISHGKRKPPRANGRAQARMLPDVLDGRCLRSVSKKDLLVDIGGRLAKELNDSSVTAHMLENILEPYLRAGVARTKSK